MEVEETPLFVDFPEGTYSVIYLDPPWKYKTSPPCAQSAAASKMYPCLSHSELETLPVESIAAEDSALLVWATSTHLEQAINLMKHWGFEYKSVFFNWVKTTSKGNLRTMAGYYTRCGSELLLLGTRGKISKVRNFRNIPPSQILMEPVGRHSAKPLVVRDLIDGIFIGDKIELFARSSEKRKGWDFWGNESGAATQQQ